MKILKSTFLAFSILFACNLATNAQEPEFETDDIKEFIEINSKDYIPGI